MLSRFHDIYRRMFNVIRKDLCLTALAITRFNEGMASLHHALLQRDEPEKLALVADVHHAGQAKRNDQNKRNCRQTPPTLGKVSISGCPFLHPAKKATIFLV